MKLPSAAVVALSVERCDGSIGAISSATTVTFAIGLPLAFRTRPVTVAPSVTVQTWPSTS